MSQTDTEDKPSNGIIFDKEFLEELLKIDIEEFTKNVINHTTDHVVTGDGIFDTLMETATKHLIAQFEANRFREETYGDAYLRLYEITLQAAMQIWLQKGVAAAEVAVKAAQIPLLEKQLELLKSQQETEDAKKNLYRRQIEGFDEDFKYKLLKAMLDTWSVGFSVAKDSFEASGIPAPMQKVTIDGLYNQFIIPELDNYRYGRPDLDV